MVKLAAAASRGNDKVAAEHALADYELKVQRRLDRTRILVRAGPAIGLMGTLIPLAPGLAALGRGDLPTLASDLRTAFAATVIGLLAGTVAFALTLTRTRMYSEDLTALERARGGHGHCLRRPARGSRENRSPSPRAADVSRVGLGRHGRLDDSAGDPLDGLVNLFDLGIVLAVAFLVAGLSLTIDSNNRRVVKRQADAAGATRPALPGPPATRTPPARPRPGARAAGGPGLPHARRPPDLRREALATRPRRAGSRAASAWPRSARAGCSNRGGSTSFSPRCSGSSSVVKPGPSVAISNSTPLGSRK